MKVIDFLTKWLDNYIKDNHLFGFVIIEGSTPADTLVSFLCQKVSRSISFSQDWYEATKIAEKTNSVVVGNIDKSSGLYYRDYKKNKEYLADIFPLYNLEYSEILKITSELFPDQKFKCPWNYEMLEFCNKAEEQYGIITDEKPPHLHSRWPYFLSSQKEWIAVVHQREKKTRHKIINKPYPVIGKKND